MWDPKLVHLPCHCFQDPSRVCPQGKTEPGRQCYIVVEEVTILGVIHDLVVNRFKQTQEKEEQKMDNQHRLIKGERDLGQEEIDLINQIRTTAGVVGLLVDEVQAFDGVDQRWKSIATTDLQKGFMALERAVKKQETF